MKGSKWLCGVMAAVMLAFSSCSTWNNMSNTGKGAIIGTTGGAAGGAALGAIIGAIAGNAGLGAAIGAGAGTAIGATAGTLIGYKMDKAKKAAEQALAAEQVQAKVETTKDANGLDAVKITIEGGVLFPSGKATLTSTSMEGLNKFANSVLKQYTDCNVAVQGYSDSDKWKGKTAEQSQQANINLSQQRADAVKAYFITCGVNSAQITQSVGFGPTNLVTNADGSENKSASRRVEIYLYASQAMIEAANNGTLQ